MNDDDLTDLRAAVLQLSRARECIKRVDAGEKNLRIKDILGRARAACNNALGWISDVPGMGDTKKG